MLRVLVVDAFAPDDADRRVVDRAIAALEAKGHEIERLSIAGDSFAGFMSAAEHRAYETDEPLIATDTKVAAEAVRRCQGLLFCYPTTLFGVPPSLKSWLERVMVLGVAFVFDDQRRIRAGLTNVRHLGVVTTTSHSTMRTVKSRDLGRRTIMRTLRLNCHPRCARTFIKMRAGSTSSADVAYLHRRLLRWR